MLDELVGQTHELTWAQECARAVLIFGYGLLLVRVAGRRVFGKWSALDIVVSIMVGSNLSRALTGSAPLWGTLAATTLLLGLHWVVAQGVARIASLSRLLEGGAIELGRDGDLDHRARRAFTVSEADLDEALRSAGIANASETRLIMLEPSGRISVLKP